MVSWADLRREPYRVFFPLAVLCGLLGANHWLAYALGWTGAYSGFYHAGIQIGGYMTGFIVGFLLTALPRFSATAPASSTELSVLLALYLAQPVSLSLGWWIAAEAASAALLVMLVVFATRRFAVRASNTLPPTEFVWIPIAILHGVVGAGLLIIGQAGGAPVWVLGVGRPMAQQGFLLSIVLGVGGFLAPRLMGRTELLLVLGAAPVQIRRVRLQRVTFHLMAGVLLWFSYWLEGAQAMRLASLLRASIVTAELAWTSRFYLAPKPRELYVRYLWASLWMVVLGLWVASLTARFRLAGLHLAFLGGFSLMTFAVGTMVILSHAGEGERLRRPWGPLQGVGWGIGSALVARVAAELWPRHFFPLLGAAAGCWSLAAIAWLVGTLPLMVRAVPLGTFERLHDAVKREAVTL